MATAQEIISTCTKYKWSTFFLKLDFAKAFDTIDWSFLLKVLHARGFGVNGMDGFSYLCIQVSLQSLSMVTLDLPSYVNGG